jgi:two-component system phosphate regulon response regulator PhoB
MQAAGNDFGDNVIEMKKILAVDDNQDILDVLRFILEDSGYEVDTLSDGHDLFQQIEKKHPDLILLDIMLGDMDGRVLCKNVKQTAETHDIPVILVSASHNISDSMKQNGAPDDFIAKPFDMHVLLNSIERQLPAA